MEVQAAAPMCTKPQTYMRARVYRVGGGQVQEEALLHARLLHGRG